MLVSVLVHLKKGRPVEILVFASGIPEEDRRKIEQNLIAVRPDFDPGCGLGALVIY